MTKTNQNVFILDTPKALADPPLPSPTRKIIVSSWRKPLKKLNPQDPSKINAWDVDSMRSSSPTHLNPDLNNLSWMGEHPSALHMFDEIANAAKGKNIVVFLDYDGTLSPIVEDPDKAYMSEEMRGAVREVAKHFPTAIVTGRCRDKVCSFVKLTELYYAGSHGMDIKGPSNARKYAQVHAKQSGTALLFQPANEYLPMIDQVYKTLVETTKSIPGAMVENNKFCAAVHFRRVDEKRWAELSEKVREVVSAYPKLRLTQGRMVFEIRPTIKWDKGKALEFLLEALGFADSDDVLPIYIGDDRTDEDAFKVLRNRNNGVGILVSKGPKDTNASFTLQDPVEVKSFLQKLVEWKCLSLRGSYLRK